jgi:hypothetical protein
MSKRRALITISFILFISAVCGYVISSQTTLNLKNKSLRPYSEVIKRTHKLHPPFVIEITADSATPLMANARFKLTAALTVNANLQNATYSWKIPDGVKYIGGDFSGEIDLGVKDSLKIITDFENLTNENKILFLVISNSSGIIHSEQFHTQDQDKIKLELVELKNRQDEYDTKSTKQDEQ